MPAYDWIIFDSTGTLMTPRPEAGSVYQSVGARQGSCLSVDEVRIHLKSAILRHFLGDTANDPTDEENEHRRWKKIVADTLPDIRGGNLDAAFAALWNHFSSADQWHLHDDVLPTLDRLKKNGYSIAIASNFDSRLIRVLKGMGATEHFDAILISSDLGWSKPNTRFYDAATDRLGAVDRSRLLMIGDTPRGDVDAARAAGWDARLLVREGENPLADLTKDLTHPDSGGLSINSTF